MIVFDTSTLILAIDPDRARPPIDPQTGKPLTNCAARVNFLIQRLNAAKEQLLIPTPIISEFLIKAGPNRFEYIQKFIAAKNLLPANFDHKAAIELALLNDPDLNSMKSLEGNLTAAKIRFDRQVVAIAKSSGASCVYAGDNNLAGCARDNGMKAVMTWELPEPPIPPQLEMPLDATKE
jgi:hypothetical protein